MSPASPHRKALAHLRKADPVMAGVIDSVGRCTLAPRTEWTHFDALVRSIVYQQLSGKAAATMHGRVLGLIGDGVAAPRKIVATSHEALRSADSRSRVASRSNSRMLPEGAPGSVHRRRDRYAAACS